MSREDYRIVIADMPDKEDPVAEIYYKNENWVVISYEDHGYFVAEFFNNESSSYWEFPYDEAMEVLEEAKNHLAKLQRTPEQQAAYEARMEEQENWNPTPEETAEYERKMEEQRKKYYG
ncbi:hypothetical protein [Candidatus Neptunichlamydia sp. REUL1]|uniref:hypothetical protein n=1 Tax=Candidatus Neptunichlamydia sp. REUL1 TaxID=3064277 RepID=UPI00292F699F|nr:hypothetical protein [Candidatus Neptunochlamydia sp. REUL1]